METYDGPLPSGITLTDTAGDINEKVNLALRMARGPGNSVVSPALEAAVYNLLGKAPPEKFWLANIEIWAMGLAKAKPGSSGKIYEPAAADSQYRDAITVGTIGGLAPVMLVNGIQIGTDKLGHFFQIAFIHYYKKTQGANALSRNDAIKEGDKTELGTLGLKGTGVYSNGDIAANQAGLKFYEDLARTPALVFDIRSYITDKWNEYANPNLYGQQAKHVWRNNLAGNWAGEFVWTDGATSQHASCQATFKLGGGGMNPFAGGPNSLEGTYTYIHPKAFHTTGTFEGKVTEHTNADGAVIRVEVAVDWKEGPAHGKGTFVISSLGHIDGKWGRLASADNGGTWSFTKV